MAYRLFVDEVGNGDMKAAAADPNSRYLSLTGYLTRQSLHEIVIQPRMDDIKTELFGHTPEKPVILHRRELVRREGPFACLRDRDTSQKFDDWLLAFIEHMPALVFTVQINKAEHLSRYTAWRHDPYHYCMQCMMERYVMWLNRHGFHGDVFVEARGKEPDRKLGASYERLYHRGTNYVSRQLFQKVLTTKKLQLKNKQANIAGLQLADLIAHPSARYMRHTAEGLTAPDDFGTKVVGLLLNKKYYRDRTTKVIEGAGLKWLP